MFACDEQISIAFFLHHRIDPLNHPLFSRINCELIIFIALCIALCIVISSAVYLWWIRQFTSKFISKEKQFRPLFKRKESANSCWLSVFNVWVLVERWSISRRNILIFIGFFCLQLAYGLTSDQSLSNFNSFFSLLFRLVLLYFW